MEADEFIRWMGSLDKALWCPGMRRLLVWLVRIYTILTYWKLALEKQLLRAKTFLPPSFAYKANV